MSCHSQHKERAKQAARHDWGAGLNCNPERYSALPGSAWAKWYTDEYNRPTTGEDGQQEGNTAGDDGEGV